MGCSSSSTPKIPASTENSAREILFMKIEENAKSRRPSLNFSASYELKEELGRGAYSVVRRGVHIETGGLVAVKCVDRKSLEPDDEASLRSEVAILRKLDHKNIVKCFDFYEEKTMFYLVMEIVAGGELFDRIVKKTHYNEREARDVIVGLVSAIAYCHKLNIVHRDIKPENLLLTSPHNDSEIKIGDFGFATEVTEDNLRQRCGTPNYVAPEILYDEPYGKQVDMWSIGVVTYVLLGGYAPFDSDTEAKMFKRIKHCDYQFHPHYWKNVSREAKDFIKRLLVTDPAQRMTAEMAANHPWVNKNAKALEKRNLNANLVTLKKFATNKKFKAAVRAIVAARRLSSMTNDRRASATGMVNETPIAKAQREAMAAVSVKHEEKQQSQRAMNNVL